MPAIRVENKSDDDIIILLDGKEYNVADSESIIAENVEKGEHTLTVHRKRIPKETADKSAAQGGPDIAKMADAKPGSHIQLDTAFSFETISSKAIISIVSDVESVETLHEDVLFVRYRTDCSGAKISSVKDRFANAEVKKNYLKKQFLGAFLPVGLIGIITFVLGAVCLFLNAGGYSLKIASNEITLPYSLLIEAGGTCILTYFIVTVSKIKKRAKKLWQK